MRPQIDGKMSCKYTLHQDLHARLAGCFFRYDDKLIYVGDVKSNGMLVVYDPVSLSVINEISPDDPRLDISSIEIGYFNFSHRKLGNRAVYMVRYPYKRWRQGVSHNNTGILSIDGEQLGPGYSTPVGNHIHHSEGFKDSIEGKFPSLTSVLSPEGEEKETAISQDVAIRSTKSGVMLVYYKTREAGFIVPKTRTVNIPNNSVADIVMDQLKGFDWAVEIN